jgi:MraZ protein
VLFRGIHSVSLDAKGRMALPARVRERLNEVSEGRVVVTIDLEKKCLLLYPLPFWDEIQAQLEALPNVDPVARRLQRMLIGHATDLELDGSGRILLPPLLRDHAELQKKLIVLGQGKKLEIWSEEHWAAKQKVDREESLADFQRSPALQSISL